MNLGVYNACLGDKPLGEALDIIAGIGMTSVEINSGGFLPPIHLPVERLRESEDARQEYLGEFSSRGLTLTALNCNGNPLFPREGFPHAKDLEDSIELAALLGVTRVITMSGAPAGSPSGTNMAWNVLPWWSPLLDVRDHQWGVAVPYWKGIQARAADADVRVAVEMHPGNIVFNPSTMHRLAEEIGSTHVGAEMDPSHLFWQGIDPVAAVDWLGELVFHAAAKDTLIHEDNCRIYGVLDDRHTRVSDNPLSLGGRSYLNRWPADPAWEFVHVGRGHDVEFWARFLAALSRVDPDMAVNIEHEDASYDPVEGLRLAAETLIAAKDRAGL
ncbi:MAG: sugar phosphate isomerase/epimerase family protein [Ornithinibacter sp.]